MIDEQAEPRYWQGAWRPRIGERVQVRLSPECRVVTPDGFLGHEGTADDGAIGIVEETPSGSEEYGRAMADRNHGIYVRFEPPIERPTEWWTGGWYCAAELSPLPAEDAEGETP